jgi:hypothetical protein
MKKFISCAVVVSVALLGVVPGMAQAAGGKGFDQYGYNDAARVFVGTCVSWAEAGGQTTTQAEAYCGAYSNDRLVMKWNKAWDECNAHGYDNATYCAGAMLTNEWNGNVTGGSGETAHDKIIWVGSEGAESTYWRPGGYLIWGNYEVIMEQGMTAEHVHWVVAHATPNGFGVGR